MNDFRERSSPMSRLMTNRRQTFSRLSRSRAIMTRLTREHLLGYLLGALDRKECEDVEQALSQSPEMTAEFEKIRLSLGTIGLLEAPEHEDPPLCLAARTCEFVEQRTESSSADTVILKTITVSSGA